MVPAFLELIDIAGLVRGASRGEGLGNQFLGHIKDVNAVIHVVRCFEDSDVVHVDGSVDPIRDVETIETELLLRDLDTAERGASRYAKAAKSGDKEAKVKAALFEKIRDSIAEGVPVRKVVSTLEEKAAIAELHLLTAKPILYVANVNEEDLSSDNEAVRRLQERALSEGAECIKICGKIESEIAELPENERVEFLESLGLEEPGLHRLVRAAYKLLGLETFFTAGEKENHAWTIRIGSTAPQAAGEIHSDFEKGFIRAEVYTVEDLEHYKSEAALKAAGKIRSEGREYVVKDGDIMFFKFNV